MDSKKIAGSIADRVKNSFKKYYDSFADSGGDGGEAAARDIQNETVSKMLQAAPTMLRGLLYFAAGVLFGGASSLLGSYPVGIGFLASSRKYTVHIYAGLLLSALFSGAELFPLLTAATMTLAARIIFVRVLGDADEDAARQSARAADGRAGPGVLYFSESLGLRTASAIIGAFFGGLIRVVQGGFLYYDLFGTMFQMLAAPVLCFTFSGLFEKGRKFSVYYEAGICTTVFAVVYSIREISIFGFSAAIVAGFFLTLYAASAGGMMRGGLIGLLCGLACSAEMSPVMAIAGLAYGMFAGMGALAPVCAAALCGTVMSVWLFGINALSSAAPDIVAASVIFLPLSKFGFLPKISLYREKNSAVPGSVANTAVIAENRRADSAEHVAAVSEAFSALAQMCAAMGKRARVPGIYETRMLCTDVFDAACRHCGSNAVCFDKNCESMSEAMDVLARRLRKNGRLEKEDLPPRLMQICETPEKLISEANRGYARLLERFAERDKSDVFAGDYESVSKILGEIASDDASEYEIDAELSGKLGVAVGYMDFHANSIAVFGKRRLRIIAGGVDLSRVRVSSEELLKVCENICMRKLSPPEFNMEGDYVTMSLSSVPVIETESAYMSLEKRDETVCGDSSLEFESADGRSYLLISDGMGSGHEAAITSRVASVFLRRMLEAGSGLTCTLELLNNFIRSRSVECFATVDLLEIDTLCSAAKFVKSGAAPSYIIRGGSLFKVASGSIPVGITKEINAEQIKFQLELGDVVVMVSDGVAQTLEDSAWLADIIVSEWEDDIGKMAEKILDAAAKRNKRKDDMTVGLVRIKAA